MNEQIREKSNEKRRRKEGERQGERKEGMRKKGTEGRRESYKGRDNVTRQTS